MPAFLANMVWRRSLPHAREAVRLRGRPKMRSQPASDGEVIGLAGEGLGGVMAGRAESAARQAEPALGGVAVGLAGEGLGSLMAGRAGSAARVAKLPTLQHGCATEGV